MRAPEEVVDQVVLSIRAGIYHEGDRLPSIEALAKQSSVSRPRVGEAVRGLAPAGVVQRSRGVTVLLCDDKGTTPRAAPTPQRLGPVRAAAEPMQAHASCPP